MRFGVLMRRARGLKCPFEMPMGLTQDMHHPKNKSLMKMHNTDTLKTEGKVITLPSGLPLLLGAYSLDDMVRTRRWKKPEELTAQVLWPDHCIIPPTDPFFPKDINTVNKRNYNQFNSVTKTSGSDLAGVLNDYKDKKPEGVPDSVTVYHVYKGFAPEKDSYSAIADAYGAFDPFIAKTNGVPMPNIDTKFAEKLLAEDNFSDIYVCGIARDFCVYWTAMDLLDLVVFGQDRALANKPKIHYIFDLTREVVPGVMTKEELQTQASTFLTGIGQANSSNYFTVEDSPNIFTAIEAAKNSGTSGGRRLTRRRSAKRSAKRSTRKHKKGCHCKKCN